MYDESLHTEFEDEFNERLQKLLEIAGDEIDSGVRPARILVYARTCIGGNVRESPQSNTLTPYVHAPSSKE